MAGIYIHIPFCKQKCSYCDFHFSTSFSSYREKMIDCICQEIIRRRNYLKDKSIETIYFGGGTPSILQKSEIEKILNSIYQNFNSDFIKEITLEANPDDICERNLKNWKDLKINRLSIGIQSFKKEDLKWMNRAHSLEEAEKCIPLAQKFGFENITVDLMYGLPNLTISEWKSHIEKIIQLNVNHISAYCLTVEEKTTLDYLVKKGRIKPASEDQQSEQFMILLKKIQSVGYEQYEISNFCKLGFESKHNSNYWKGKWYLGVGPSAHSFNGTSRSWNVSNNHNYIKSVQEKKPFSEIEYLTSKDQFNEYILTGLRTIYGVELKKLEQKHPIPNGFIEKTRHFEQSNWLIIQNDVLTLTPNGRLKADFIASEFFL